jgi:hypothetical protein
VYGQTSRDMRRLGRATLFILNGYYQLIPSSTQIPSRGPHSTRCMVKQSLVFQLFEVSTAG